MRFWQKQQVIIFLISTGLMLWFLVFEYFPLQKREIALKEAELAQTVARVKAATQQMQLPVLSSAINKLTGEVADFDARIPPQMELGSFLQQIADVMNKFNLKDQLVEPGREFRMQETNCIPVSMRCRGRLEQIFGFYQSLCRLDRAITIEQLELINDKDFTGNVDMQAKARIYYGVVN